jgi:hypothetical protein
MTIKQKNIKNGYLIILILLAIPLIIQGLKRYPGENSTADEADKGVNKYKSVQLQVLSESENGLSLQFKLGDYKSHISPEGKNKNPEEEWRNISAMGLMSRLEPGQPDLPCMYKYIAIPNGSRAILNYDVENSRPIQNIVVSPVPEPRSTAAEDTSGLVYIPNKSIYQTNRFFPLEPVSISEERLLRGVRIITLKIYPFQYNPIKQEIIANHLFDIQIKFDGGNGEFGESRLRSPWIDPVLKAGLLNGTLIEEVKSTNPSTKQNSTGAEYLIIRPNGADFQQWADTIKKYRQEMGIPTKVVSLAEIGGNSQSLIKNYITNAYNNWDIPPVAVLLLGDHGTDANSRITSFILTNHPHDGSSYGADNQYVYINGGITMVIARITARNASELEAIIRKFMEHEYNPPMNASFYNPTSCLGWEDGSWFQVAGENLSGYFQYFRNRTPNRIYSVHNGNPSGGSWQTSSTQVDYWGPNGLGYLTAAPNPAYSWNSGNSTMINQAINNGTFLIQHHDHGYTNGSGWHRPYYTTGQTSGLSNTTYPFMMSFNCSSGRYTNEDCFSDNILRRRTGVQGHGALGIIASSSVSYFFSNENMCWGIYDYLWPDFMPDKEQISGHLLLPAFGLLSSKWYSNAGSLTNDLYHHFGDAFLTLYDTVPRNPLLTHQPHIHPDDTLFEFSSEEGIRVSLSIEGDIIQSIIPTSGWNIINLPDTLEDGDIVLLTTSFGRNIIPSRSEILVSETRPKPNIEELFFADSGINSNELFDYNEIPFLNLKIRNQGLLELSGYTLNILHYDSLLSIQDSSANLPSIPGGQSIWIDSLFQLAVNPVVPDNHTAWILFQFEKADTSFQEKIDFPIYSAAAKISKAGTEAGIGGNWNNLWEAGEEGSQRIKLENTATSSIANLKLNIFGGDEWIQIIDSVLYFHNLKNDSAQYALFKLFASPDCPMGHSIPLVLKVSDTDHFLEWNDTMEVRLRSNAMVIDLDDANSSASALTQALVANGIPTDLTDEVSENIYNYRLVFVCLGTYPNAHPLSLNEGLILSKYLDQHSGKLYLEGAETWCYDPPVAVHPYFKILCEDDGVNHLHSIYSVYPDIDPGLTFSYTGDNQYIDQIDTLPGSGSILLLRNVKNTIDFGTSVYFDGETYQTIGASHEFRGLVNGGSNRNQLMAEYLACFGISPIVHWLGHSTEWFDTQNWSNSRIPDGNTIVNIPTNPIGGFMPTQFQQSVVHCKTLIVHEGAIFSLPQGIEIVID